MQLPPDQPVPDVAPSSSVKSAVKTAKKSDDESDDEERVRWSLQHATKAVQYVPLSRNSQLLLMKKMTTRHLWSDAANLMKMLLTDARHPPLLVFRYGMLVLQHYAPTDDSLFRQYYHETMAPFVMRFLTHTARDSEKIKRAVVLSINKIEIILDVSALLFYHHCDEEMEELSEWLLKDKSGQRARRQIGIRNQNRVIEQVYNGYEAYMRFLKWQKQGRGGCSGDDEDGGGSEFTDQEKLIVALLSSVVNSTGNFSVDLFLESLLQMYESKGKYEEAVRVTDSHSCSHADDLHAHLRRYDMIDKRIDQVCRSEDEDDDDLKQLEIRRTQCFQQILRLSPNHSLVRDVAASDQAVDYKAEAEDDVKEEDLRERIRVLMNFVDYRANMQDVSAWQAIRRLTSDMAQKDPHAFRLFRRFFAARVADYWKHVHFNCENIPHEAEPLVQCKLGIVELCDVCPEYRKAVQKRGAADHSLESETESPSSDESST